MFIDPIFSKSKPHITAEEQTAYSPRVQASEDKVSISEDQKTTQATQPSTPDIPPPSIQQQWLTAVPDAILKMMKEVRQGDKDFFSKNKEFSISNAAIYSTLTELLNTLQERLLSESIRYKELEAIMKKLGTDSEAWKNFAASLNKDASELLKPPPIWDRYNEALEKLILAMNQTPRRLTWADAAKQFNQFAESFNKLINEFNNKAKDYNKSIDNYNSDIKKYINEIELANREIEALNIQRRSQGLPPLPLKQVPDDVVPIPESAKVPLLPNAPILETTGKQPPQSELPPFLSPLPISLIDYVLTPLAPLPQLDIASLITNFWLPVATRVSLVAKSQETFLQTIIENFIPALLLFKQAGKTETKAVDEKNIARFLNSFAGSIAFVGITFSATNKKIKMENIIKEIVKQEELKDLDKNKIPIEAAELAKQVSDSLNYLVNSTAVLAARNAVGLTGFSLPFLKEDSDTLNLTTRLGITQQIQELVTSKVVKETIENILAKSPGFSSLPEQARKSLTEELTGIATLSLANLSTALLKSLFPTTLPQLSSLAMALTTAIVKDEVFDLTELTQSAFSTLNDVEKQTFSNTLFSNISEIVSLRGINPAISGKIAIRTSNLIVDPKTIEIKKAVLRELEKEMSKEKAIAVFKDISNTLASQLFLVQIKDIPGFDLDLTQPTLISAAVNQITDKIKEEIGDTESLHIEEALTKNLMVTERIFTDALIQLSQKNDKKSAKIALELFRESIKEIINPQVNIDYLINGVRQFIGIITEGIKTGFQRGDVDIAV